MSNIYIQEPPANGKVLLKTTAGDIDLELWTKETPKTCKNFIQLCLEGYYNGTIFHRVVPDFIIQGGDPNGDGTGGESIYGVPFKDEFHSRLRFNRRGLVASANSGKDDNASQFFFTLAATPELQNKHTIFGKVTGDTIFNVLKLAEGETDADDRPLYPKKIISTEVLVNPFTDIVPRKTAKESKKEAKETDVKKASGVKNFGLLSFGEEAEDDEEETTVFRGKPKSTHDLLDDPKLSRLTSNDVDPMPQTSEQSKEEDEATKVAVSNIRDKLNRKGREETSKKIVEEPQEDESEEEYYLGKDRVEARKKQAEEIRNQIKDLKREMSGKKKKDTEEEAKQQTKEAEKPTNEMVKQFEEEQDKYRKMKEKLPKKGESREQFTLSLLKKFQNKLLSAKEKAQESKEEGQESSKEQDKEEMDADDINGDDWLAHELHFEDKGAVLAKDASTKGDDWFDIYDPRNPLNKRKREQSKAILQNKTRKKE